MVAESVLLKIVDILPGEGKDIADAKGGVDPSTDQGVIPQIGLFLKIIIFQRRKVFFVFNWL